MYFILNSQTPHKRFYLHYIRYLPLFRQHRFSEARHSDKESRRSSGTRTQCSVGYRQRQMALSIREGAWGRPTRQRRWYVRVRAWKVRSIAVSVFYECCVLQVLWWPSRSKRWPGCLLGRRSPVRRWTLVAAATAVCLTARQMSPKRRVSITTKWLARSQWDSLTN